MCITINTWTSINTDNFLTITCHFISLAFELKSYAIETTKMIENHTARTLANRLDTISIEWGIQDKVIAVVTGNAANMVVNVWYLSSLSNHISCFAHTINLIVKKSLDNIAESYTRREKCRCLVMYFKYSPIAKNKLSEM